MVKKKVYLIEAVGRYFIRTKDFTVEKANEQSRKAIADMLRYDNGEVFVLDIKPEKREYTAIIRCKGYTKARWDSFSIRTKEVEGKITENKEGSVLNYQGHEWFLPHSYLRSLPK